MTAVSSHLGWLPATGLLLLGSLGFSAAWILLGNRMDSLCSPMAVLAALDAAVLLHLLRVRRGVRRMLLALAVTLGSALVAIGGLVSTRAGQYLGLSPWEFVQRLGLVPIRLLVEMSVTRIDLAWLFAGMVVAVVLARR